MIFFILAGERPFLLNSLPLYFLFPPSKLDFANSAFEEEFPIISHTSFRQALFLACFFNSSGFKVVFLVFSGFEFPRNGSKIFFSGESDPMEEGLLINSLSKLDALTDSCKCSSGIPKSARSLDTTELVKSVLFRIGVGCLIFFVDIVWP